MKKKILSAVVAAAALFGAYTAQQASSTVALSDAQIENIEALAGGEPLPVDVVWYDIDIIRSWHGYATDPYNHMQAVVFEEIACPVGSTYFSCTPGIRVKGMFYDHK